MGMLGWLRGRGAKAESVRAMGLERVREAYELVRGRMREDGCDRTDSVWLAATKRGVRSLAGRSWRPRWGAVPIGTPGKTVAWVYAAQSRLLYRVSEHADKHWLVTLFCVCLGYDL